MKISVITTTAKTIAFECKESDTIKDMKEMIKGKEGIPQEQQRLIYAGVQMEDRRTLSEYGINKDQNIHLDVKPG